MYIHHIFVKITLGYQGLSSLNNVRECCAAHQARISSSLAVVACASFDEVVCENFLHITES